MRSPCISSIHRFALAIVAVGLAGPLCAGEEAAVATTAPDAEVGLGDQSWFGPPYIQFARKASDTLLPGYTVGTLNYAHRFAGDFDSLAGDITSDEFRFWTPIAAFNRGEYHLFAWLGYGADKYYTSFPSLMTKHTLQSAKMPIVFLDDVSENWLWGVMVMPEYSGTESSSDNFAVSVAGGVGYSVNDNLELFAGVYYFHGFGSDTVIPGAAFIWRPIRQVEVYLLPPMGGISYSVNENFFLSLYGQYDSPDWHVEADKVGPDRDISVSGLRLGLKAEYHIYGLAWAYAAAGYTVFREYDVDFVDSAVSMEKSDIDPSPYIEFGFNARF